MVRNGGETLSSPGGYSRAVEELSSGTDHEFRSVDDASDSDSDAGTTASFTMDSNGGTEPAIDTSTATTADSPNPHAEITVDWAVSDADGDLASVTSEDNSGHVTTSSVGDGSASGRHEHTVNHGGGQSHTVTLRVTDETGWSASDSTTVDSSGGRGRGY